MKAMGMGNASQVDDAAWRGIGIVTCIRTKESYPITTREVRLITSFMDAVAVDHVESCKP
jgi:hypothetical protein